MKTTVNQLRVELQAIQQAHGQLNSFFWGDFLRAVKEREVRYPLMCCYYNDGAINKVTTSINLILVVADRVFKGYENLNDTESDTLQVCRDILNIMTRSRRWNKLGRVESASAQKFIDKQADEVTGHVLRVSLTLVDSNDLCGLPLFGYDFDQSFTSTFPPVTIFNSDQTYLEVIPAGTAFELPDVNNVDTYGDVVPTPAQVPFVCSPALPATITNSDDTYEQEVGSGETLELPDITVTNTYGDEVEVPAQTDFTCDAALPAAVHNSDFSYSQTIASDADDLLPDETINIYVNGVLQDSGTRPPLSNEPVNINIFI